MLSKEWGSNNDWNKPRMPIFNPGKYSQEILAEAVLTLWYGINVYSKCKVDGVWQSCLLKPGLTFCMWGCRIHDFHQRINNFKGVIYKQPLMCLQTNIASKGGLFFIHSRELTVYTVDMGLIELGHQQGLYSTVPFIVTSLSVYPVWGRRSLRCLNCKILFSVDSSIEGAMCVVVKMNVASIAHKH